MLPQHFIVIEQALSFKVGVNPIKPATALSAKFYVCSKSFIVIFYNQVQSLDMGGLKSQTTLMK